MCRFKSNHALVLGDSSRDGLHLPPRGSTFIPRERGLEPFGMSYLGEALSWLTRASVPPQLRLCPCCRSRLRSARARGHPALTRTTRALEPQPRSRMAIRFPAPAPRPGTLRRTVDIRNRSTSSGSTLQFARNFRSMGLTAIQNDLWAASAPPFQLAAQERRILFHDNAVRIYRL